MSEGDVRIFIGSEPDQLRAERVLEYSIRANASHRSQVKITMMRSGLPGWDDWVNPKNPTAFTLFRFAIPELCHFNGLAIYLDCDQLVLGDIFDLAIYYRRGKWCAHPHREGDAVSVIDCHAVGRIQNWPTIDELKSGKLRKWDVRGRLEPIVSRSIPTAWNSMDKLDDATKLIHFTDLKTQPWDPDAIKHADQEAVRLWFAWEGAMKRFEDLPEEERHVMCRPA